MVPVGVTTRKLYEDFTAAIDSCLINLPKKHKHQMATLLTLNFQTFADEPVLAA